jgi:enoyl-CoA hydratase
MPSLATRRRQEPVVPETTEPILVRERRGAVVVLRLNRPEARNAFNPALMGELGIGLAEAEADPDIRAVVLTGTGDRAFSAGMDLRAFAEGDADVTPEQQGGQATFGRFTAGDLSVPIVGAAQATAVAGGFELLLGCDVVVASEEAKFGLPEVKRALFAAGGGVFISQRIPLAVALEMTLTGDTIDADRAYELGLVNQVVPAGRVVDAGIAMAERIARNGPLALAATKELVRLANTNAAKAVERQAELAPTVFGSEDAKEGARAFIEKREPVWQGK